MELRKPLKYMYILVALEKTPKGTRSLEGKVHEREYSFYPYSKVGEPGVFSISKLCIPKEIKKKQFKI
jgi:hypothetical protein